MGRGKSLSLEEKSKIETYKECGLSIHKIAEKIGRSRKVISMFLRNTTEYGKNFEGGNHKVVSSTDRRAILREASNSHDSAAKIRANTGVEASLSTVQRVIRNAKHLKRLKLKKNTTQHGSKRNALGFCSQPYDLEY